MPNIEIKYTFDTYEDKEDLEMLMLHKNYFAALTQLQDFIRHKTKYEENQTVTVDELSEKFCEIINDNGINLLI